VTSQKIHKLIDRIHHHRCQPIAELDLSELGLLILAEHLPRPFELQEKSGIAGVDCGVIGDAIRSEKHRISTES
jgi:hypothetical protein